jgi:protein O-GlcNAc transferase
MSSQSVAELESALRLDPDNAELLKKLGNARKASGDSEGAIASYRRSLAVSPDYLPSLYNLGLILHEISRLDEAEECFRRVHDLDANDADALSHLASILANRSRFAETVEVCRKALCLAPENPYLWMHLGVALQEMPNRTEESVRCLGKSVAFKPDLAEAHYHLARAHKKLGGMEDAVASYRRSLELGPATAEAHNDLANIFQDEGRMDSALAHYREAIRIAPDYAMAHSNLGCALVRANRLDEAAESLQKAVALAPGYANAHLNLGSVRTLQGGRDEALRSYRAALDLQPNDAAIRECLLSEMQNTCEWAGFDKLCDLQRGSVSDASQRISPFSLLSIPSTPGEQLQCARNFAQRHSNAVAGQRARLNFRFERAPKEKLTIGYLSADFHEHATAYLTAELFELHDRSRFRIIGYSYGRDDGSPMRARLQRAFDRFVDLEALPHADAAAAIHADGIDILVDLKGYTANTRSEIMALRPAPIQVSYLGYPGTMGADFIDYLVGDRYVTPPEHAEGYSEKLVLMPGSYQANDRKRPIIDPPSRRELGLPDDAFVFCCFNQAYKILPEVFSSWMRLLQAAPQSVLWLLDWNAWATQNLQREARKRGIDAGRLIFAPKLPLDEHLGRLGAADLFLDTLPYNAHTMASDALWVGVPIVTCAGNTFASRVAGSLLTAIGMPELITSSMPDYEALAIRLARSPGELASLRHTLSRNRSVATLFDTPRFTGSLETAYQRMWTNYLDGVPQSFEV